MVTETQIANRALQRVGAGPIADGAMRTEQSKDAREVRNCYDIVRRAELRRNAWNFSIRTVPLRAISATSKLVFFGDYDAAATYAFNDIVLATDGQIYFSKNAANLGNTPQTSLLKWELYVGPDVADVHDADETYYAGELVYVGAVVYLSLQSANGDTPPSAKWLTLTETPTITFPQFIYPIGSGPSSDLTSRNVYKLPVGYLRLAEQDVDAGILNGIGLPISARARDWRIENKYLTTHESGVLLFRFGADIADPSYFDPLFVEGFASRIALEVCEPITQSNTKLVAIASEYDNFMGEARTANGIESGPMDAVEDEWVSCRQ